MAESSKITIMGQEFVLKGAHDQQYLKRVEDFLNNKIDEARRAGGPVDSTQMLMMVSLNLVDDYLKILDELQELRNNVEENAVQIINLIDSNI